MSRPGAAGITVQVAHPLRVRAFARACGCEAKTDALDARVLARFGQVASDTGPSGNEELQQRLRRHWQRLERVRERNRLDKGVGPAVGRSTRRWASPDGPP